MEILEQVQPSIPVEILNIISTYLEDSAVVTRYHLTSGTRIARIQWNSSDIATVEAMLMVKRFFPSYFQNIHQPEYRCIYFNAKSYFTNVLVRRRRVLPFR
jgi:hypothetical protein